MSRHGLVVTPWADGDHAFRLGLDGIEEVEEACGASLFEIHDRLSLRTARLKDISTVLRVGLIGGGSAPVDALGLVRRYCDERPLDESRDVALVVVLAGLARVHGDDLTAEDDPSGEADAPAGASASVTTSE